MKFDLKENLRYLFSVLLVFMFFISVVDNSFTKMDSFLILLSLVGVQWVFSIGGKN